MPKPPAGKVTNSARSNRTRSVSRRHRLTSLTMSGIGLLSFSRGANSRHSGDALHRPDLTPVFGLRGGASLRPQRRQSPDFPVISR
jgi:hypothetical protein